VVRSSFGKGGGGKGGVGGGGGGGVLSTPHSESRRKEAGKQTGRIANHSGLLRN